MMAAYYLTTSYTLSKRKNANKKGLKRLFVGESKFCLLN